VECDRKNDYERGGRRRGERRNETARMLWGSSKKSESALIG
jgi:hypothetical protein